MPQPATGTLTFFFTDIEGSTARWEQQREAMSSALQRHDAILRAAIEGSGGTVFKTVGDAFCAVFPSASDALTAALDAQQALSDEDWSAYGPDFADLRVRMGIHQGLAEARGGDYFGPALNRTARLMAAGHGGQVLLSGAAAENLRTRLPERVTLRDLGEHRLKDLRHAERIWQVVAGDLRDDTRSVATAGELGARDRIVVTDPGAADFEAGEQPTVLVRTVPETLAALHSVVRHDSASVVLTAEQVRQAARHQPADLTEYRLGRIAEWSQPRYRLDGRFVVLTLLVDQGEEILGERWLARQERYDDLGALLASTPDPALVVLGAPGSGKSTLLRHMELNKAVAALRGEDPADTVTFFIQLNQYRAAEPGLPPPSPDRWLAARWAAAYPKLPPLDDLLAEGRVILLLDALNEMPAGGDRDYRDRVGWWKDWLQRLVKEKPGNRVIFSCRTLDYSAPLSTPALRVPQARIEALDDDRMREFLRLYSPLRGGAIWSQIAGKPQLEALRSPYFLALLVDQVEATGDLAVDRAGLFTAFVRQALKREVERDNPLFTLEALLTPRDIRRIGQWQWRTAHELPEKGQLFPKLAELAYRMQEAGDQGGATQVRVALDEALALLETEADAAIVQAGEALAVLDEDQAADTLMYVHQLVQEYFAARVLARRPRPELVAAPWRAAEIRPTVPELLATLPLSETLPPLPQTGWEETTLLAAAMVPEAELEGLVRGLMSENLALAGRVALLPESRGRLGEELMADLRLALATRCRDPQADLRHRIACAEALGQLGDPRWERRTGPYGDYLLGPMVEIPGGRYPIGADEPISGMGRNGMWTATAHMPRHEVPLAPYCLGRYAVTIAEFDCFVAAGCYRDERWWESEDARRWLRGEIANEGAKMSNRAWRRRFQTEPGLFERHEAEGGFPGDTLERWKHWMQMDDAAFEADLAELRKGRPQTGPRYRDWSGLNGPTQPVVGVCWFEARAYAAWLSAQTGEAYRLPTEVEWEAAVRGTEGRFYAWGDDYAPERANTVETRLRRTVPVGVFVEGDSPEGLSDLCGNSAVVTDSLYGHLTQAGVVLDFAYPYRADDGREDMTAPHTLARVSRGGQWYADHEVAGMTRGRVLPDQRFYSHGLRLARSCSTAPRQRRPGATQGDP